MPRGRGSRSAAVFVVSQAGGGRWLKSAVTSARSRLRAASSRLLAERALIEIHRLTANERIEPASGSHPPPDATTANTHVPEARKQRSLLTWCIGPSKVKPARRFPLRTRRFPDPLLLLAQLPFTGAGTFTGGSGFGRGIAAGGPEAGICLLTGRILFRVVHGLVGCLAMRCSRPSTRMRLNPRRSGSLASTQLIVLAANKARAMRSSSLAI